MTVAIATLIVIAAAMILGFFAGGIIEFALVPMISGFFDASVNFLSIPIVSTVILWGQGISIAAVIALRVGIGIKEMMLGSPDREFSLTEYIYKSVTAIILVALMPTLCAAVINLGDTMLADIKGGIGAEAVLDNLTTNDYETLLAGANPVAVIQMLISSILLLVALIMCVIVMYQFAKRQIEMGIVALIAPWVSILAGTTNDSSQYWDLLKNLFGMCVTQWLQYLLCIIGMSWLANLAASAGDVYSLTLVPQTFVSMFFILAIFGASIGVARLIDRYTFSSASSGTGAMLAGIAARGGASKLAGLIGRK